MLLFQWCDQHVHSSVSARPFQPGNLRRRRKRKTIQDHSRPCRRSYHRRRTIPSSDARYLCRRSRTCLVHRYPQTRSAPRSGGGVSAVLRSPRRVPRTRSLRLLSRGEVIGQGLVHLKHVDLVAFEDGVHRVVAKDVALVLRVLQLVRLHIRPDPLHRLRS